MRALIVLIVMSFAINSYAGQSLFTIKKSFNKLNIFKVEAQADQNCKLIPYPSRKYITGYWIMGEEHHQRQEMNQVETKGFNKAIMTYLSPNRTEVDFMPENVEKARAYFSNPVIKVRASVKNARCQIEAFMDIDNIEIKLQTVHLELTTFLNIDYVILRGNRPDGTIFLRKYQ